MFEEMMNDLESSLEYVDADERFVNRIRKVCSALSNDLRSSCSPLVTGSFASDSEYTISIKAGSSRTRHIRIMKDKPIVVV
jgi:hypothetical protein